MSFARRPGWSAACEAVRVRAWLGWVALMVVALTASAGGEADLPPVESPLVLLVVGAPGESEYATNFSHQAELWEATATRGGARVVSIGRSATPGATDREQLEKRLAAELATTAAPLWLVLIGHGTFDGHEARFNLRGPDVSATELAQWLKPARRPLAIINTASASAPFLNALSASNRIVVTATRSGSEQSFARFGEFLARAIGDPRSDLDQDGQTSLLEAYLATAAQVAEFYKTAGRLATEHALLDDNGDGRGTPAEWFRGVRAVKQPGEKAAPDGAWANQWHLVPSPAERGWAPDRRARRDALELAVEALRTRKATLPESEYFRELEGLLLELAKVTLEAAEPPARPGGGQ